MSNSTDYCNQACKLQEANTMTWITFSVAIPSFLVSLPVIYVLRSYFYYFVCYSCCHCCCCCERNSSSLKPPHNRRFRKSATQPDIILSIILCLQTSDLIYALGYMMSPLNETDWVCVLQGIILQLSSTIVMIFSACLSVELWIVIKAILDGKSSAKNGRQRLFIYCISACVLSLVFLICDAIVVGFGRATKYDSWCWTKSDNNTFSFLSYYGVAICVLVVIVVDYGMVAYTILRKIGTITHSGIRATLWRTFFKVGVYPIFLVIIFVPCCKFLRKEEVSFVGCLHTNHLVL